MAKDFIKRHRSFVSVYYLKNTLFSYDGVRGLRNPALLDSKRKRVVFLKKHNLVSDKCKNI